MSIERDLISKILLERDLSVVTDMGVKPQFFQNSEHRQAFESILAHQAQYSTVPPIDTFRRDYPKYRVTDAGDAMQYYVDEIRYNYSLFLLEEGLTKAVDLYDSGQDTASKDEIARLLNQLNMEVVGSKAVDLTQTGADRLERYRLYSKMDGSLKGIPTGIPTIDYATGGMQPQQLFTFVGPPKAGKSTLLLLAMIAASQGFWRPLFIGFEMSNEEQEERHDSIRAGVSHRRLRDGRLERGEMERLERMTRRMEAMPPMIFSEDVDSSLTLSGVASQVERYKPDVVYIDGVYMMEDENGEAKGSPQALTNITRGFKMMAKNRKVPIGISTQVLGWKMDRKRGVTTQSIGYSSSFAQDSDVLIGVEPTDEDDVNKIKILDGRNVKRMETYVRWDWDTGAFEELEGYGEEPESDSASKF